MSKKSKKWTKLRHRVVRNLAYAVLYAYCKIKYGLSVTPFAEQEDRPYLILFNHQTAFDQFFVGMAFKGPVYYVASEDLFSNGLTSALIRWLVAPIPIKKQATDVAAVKNCIRVAREGGTIAMAPEGNRTYSGKTEYINPAVVPLAKKLGLPIALYRIEGGYGVHPRWSDVVRKGKTRGYVARVVSPEQYKNLSDDELFAIINETLYVNEANADEVYLSKKSAEYLERAVYVCPFCNLSEFYSEGNEISCKKCGRTIRYNSDKSLEGVGFEFPFKFANDWYEYQEKFVCEFDCDDTQTPLYTEKISLFGVELYKKKYPLAKNVTVRLFTDRMEIDAETLPLVFPFKEVSTLSVLGKNKLNLYFDGKVYQIKGDKRFNALKYVNFCYRFKSIEKGEKNVKFLGL